MESSLIKCRYCERVFEKRRKDQITCGKPTCKKVHISQISREKHRRRLLIKGKAPSRRGRRP